MVGVEIPHLADIVSHRIAEHGADVLLHVLEAGREHDDVARHGGAILHLQSIGNEPDAILQLENGDGAVSDIF